MTPAPTRDSSQKFLKIFEDYNSFFRLWIGLIPGVCISNPDFIQKLLTNKNGLEKSFLMKYFGKEAMGDSIILSDVVKWKHNRGIVARGFTPLILKSYFKIFVEKSLMLVEKLDEKLNDGESFDIYEYLSKTTLEAVCGSTMGVNIDIPNSYCSALESAFHLGMHRIYHFWEIPNCTYRWTDNYKKFNESIKTVREFTHNVFLQKKKYYNSKNNENVNEIKSNLKNEFKKPLLEYLIDFAAVNSDFTEEDIEIEANLAIMAGYETLSTTLSYVILNLALHKDIQNKVCEELFEVLDNDSDRTIAVEDLSKLKYMEMVIKESMRLYAPVPLISRQLTDDIKFGDWLIPQGVSCVVSIFSLHRDGKIWNNPLKFDPDRFTPENSKTRHPYAHIPFSAGPRNCLGDRYAWMLMKAVLATLLRRYEFHTDLKENALEFEIAITLKLIGGHQVRITSRNQDCF
ncbi:cytochrome P450 4C1-like [Chrysoperla carnea]|uniref:cytochrome P450 4C1-like n=1 Tax=Chrysoperla carnea TaxID=189513 RepID=UPI001D07A751|nr:cytochrome P450 4C1-like [Chrysoperla carnea]